MSEPMNERDSTTEWQVSPTQEQPFEWKGENSSDYLWNEDLYKAHTSGTPSDEQVGISGEDGAGDIDREPQQLDLDSAFNSPREMGSVSETPVVRASMMSPVQEGKDTEAEEFSIKEENKTPHPRPINTPQGIPVDLLNKAIEVLSAPADEVDIADDISVLLKNWEGSGYDDADDIQNTNWDPKERNVENSIATVDSDEKELGDGEAEDVDENLADVSSQLRDKAKKDVVNEAKKMMSAAKKATDAGIKEAEEEITPPDEAPQNMERGVEEDIEFGYIAIEKQLAMGHGRCPCGNQIDLCEKCGDMEIKSHHEDGIEKGVRNVTRKVTDDEEVNWNKSMDNLLKALEDVETALAADTGDYEGLMKALSSQIKSYEKE